MTPIRKAIAAGSLAVLLALAGCNAQNNTRGLGDAHVGRHNEDNREVWNNIDGFPNISAWCIGVNGAYTTTRDGVAMLIVKDDANCKPGGRLYKVESGSQG